MAAKKKRVSKKAGKSKSAGRDLSIAEDSKSLYPMLGQKENTIEDISLRDYTEECLRVYGSYVVEDRAVPDFRDGCKPVHRALLWSLSELGLTPDKGYKKAARTVGDTIGKFHPHGDTAAYGAMVTIANTMPPAVDGQGNWGTPINPAAAQRYTEAKMSKFAHLFMLDSKYLAVVPKVPNFSGDDVIPLYLPALLPYVLFNGNVPAPAYGVRAGNPSFSLPSVAKIVVNMLKGKAISAKTLAKNLEILHPYGCESVTSDEEYLSMMGTGKGSIVYAPLMSADFKTRKINIRSFVPAGLSSKGTIDKTLAKLSNLNGVKKVFSKQGKKTKGSGPYGAMFIVTVGRNVGEDAFADLVELVEKHVTNSVGYRLGITIRKDGEQNKFKYLSYVTFFEQWIKYRIALELKLIKSLIVKAERDLHVNEVYLFAVENMDKILKALPKVLTSSDPDKTLAKILDIPVENAVIILDRKVRQLAKMEADALKAKIKDLKAEIKALNADLKTPGERAARDTSDRVKKYLKKPDANKSGLTFE
jgi:topoisomerase-4 subunit A